MKTFNLTTEYETYNDCYFLIGEYEIGGNLFLEIWNDEEGPIATLTKNSGMVKRNEAYLDVNNYPWVENFIKDLGIGKPTGKLAQSGFCTYPLYEFDMDKVKEYVGITDDEGVDEAEVEYCPSATHGDYSPSCPWNAPGMKMSDFI